MTNDSIQYPAHEMKRDEMIREARRQHLMSQANSNRPKMYHARFTRLMALLASLFPLQRI